MILPIVRSLCCLRCPNFSSLCVLGNSIYMLQNDLHMFSMYGKTEVEVFRLKLGQGPQPHSLGKPSPSFFMCVIDSRGSGT
uniref:Uncharacterized protein n=1 Tax=Monodon monoceros TaxID=40151 RepID=A0A8C6BMV0_MONMO